MAQEHGIPVTTVGQHLGQILMAAVEDGLIVRNPATGARMPKAEASKAQPVPTAVVEAIAANCPVWFRVAIVLGVGVGVGLRRGEVVGLTVDRVDFLRRTLRVDRQLVTTTGGARLREPKTRSSFPRSRWPTSWSTRWLAAHIAEHGRGDDGLIFHQPDGRPVDSSRFGAAWRSARKAAGAPFSTSTTCATPSPRRCSVRASQ